MLFRSSKGAAALGVDSPATTVIAGDDGRKIYARNISGFNVFSTTDGTAVNNIKVYSTNPEVVGVTDDGENKLIYKKAGKARIIAYDKDSELYALTDINVMPAEYSGSTDYTFPRVDSGYNFNIALKADGTVWAWGANDYGQLGINDNSVRRSSKPMQVKLLDGSYLTGVKDVAAGDYFTLALTENNTV